MKIKCPKCKYEWDTKSKLVFVSCPSISVVSSGCSFSSFASWRTFRRPLVSFLDRCLSLYKSLISCLISAASSWECCRWGRLRRLCRRNAMIPVTSATVIMDRMISGLIGKLISSNVATIIVAPIAIPTPAQEPPTWRMDWKMTEARIITATNVFAHIDPVNEVVDNILELLSPDGIFVSE